MDDFNMQPQADDQAYADWLEMSRYNLEIFDEDDWLSILDNDIDPQDIEDMPF